MILDIRSNNNNFLPYQAKIKPIHNSFIPGNEPIKYMNYQDSHDEDFVTTNKTIDSTLSLKSYLSVPSLTPSMDFVPPTALSLGDDDVNTPVTSNCTMHMSKSEIDILSKRTKVIIPSTSFKSRSIFNDYLFQDKLSIPKGITDTIQSINNNELYLNPLLGSDSFTDVINHILK